MQEPFHAVQQHVPASGEYVPKPLPYTRLHPVLAAVYAHRYLRVVYLLIEDIKLRLGGFDVFLYGIELFLYGNDILYRLRVLQQLLVPAPGLLFYA